MNFNINRMIKIIRNFKKNIAQINKKNNKKNFKNEKNSPSEYFADTPVGDPELAGNITRPDPLVRKFHDPLSDHIG